MLKKILKYLFNSNERKKGIKRYSDFVLLGSGCVTNNLEIEIRNPVPGQIYMKIGENSIVSGKFVHFDNAPLKWQFGNVVITQDPAGNIKVDKDKSKDKVDGVAATVNAMYNYQYWTANQAPENPYEKREFIFI